MKTQTEQHRHECEAGIKEDGMRTTLSGQRVRELLSYDPITGSFAWIKPTSRRVSAGSIAAACGVGRRAISIDGKKYHARSIAWLYMTDSLPCDLVFYADGDRSNLSWKNISQKKARAGDPMTAERLREILLYDPGSGIFTWKKSYRANTAGRVAGTPSSGYVVISILKKRFHAHRLAWLYVYGSWPDGEIDHINGIRDDNRIANLRDVPGYINNQNQRKAPSHNKSTKLLGTSFCKQTGRYSAQIHINRKKIHLGRFDTPELAHAAYVLAKRTIHAGCTI